MKLDSETEILLCEVLKLILPRLKKLAASTKTPVDDYIVKTLAWLVNAMDTKPITFGK